MNVIKLQKIKSPKSPMKKQKIEKPKKHRKRKLTEKEQYILNVLNLNKR